MNGVHDLGGMHGFGAVLVERDEPVFHAAWEGRVMAISRLCMRAGLFNLDEMRHAIERIPPARYLAASYYERWTMAITGLLIEKGVIQAQELTQAPPVALSALALNPAADTNRPRLKARFAPGDRVLTRNFHPRGHTRLPRYARGKHGVIARDEGVFKLPDTLVNGGGERRQHCYSVRFEARELWGEDGLARSGVYLDLWEHYLKPDPQERRAAKPTRSKHVRRSS